MDISAADIQNMITEALNQREYDNQFNVSPIANHVHNGTDSPLIDKGANGLTGAGLGSVTTVSIVTANGIAGSVANPTSTPAITLALGNITPTTIVASGNISGANLSGTNTGDGVNKGTATTGQYSSAEYDNGNIATTATISWANGNVQYATMTANTALTFSSPISGARYLLQLAGAFTPSWPANVRWKSDVTPTPTATSGRKDIYTFVYSAKESLYDGSIDANYKIT